jgi:hypothetical protein
MEIECCGRAAAVPGAVVASRPKAASAASIHFVEDPAWVWKVMASLLGAVKR